MIVPTLHRAAHRHRRLQVQGSVWPLQVVAIAFGPPLTRAPGEAPKACGARLRAVCHALTRQPERAPAPAEDRP